VIVRSRTASIVFWSTYPFLTLMAGVFVAIAIGANPNGALLPIVAGIALLVVALVATVWGWQRAVTIRVVVGDDDLVVRNFWSTRRFGAGDFQGLQAADMGPLGPRAAGSQLGLWLTSEDEPFPCLATQNLDLRTDRSCWPLLLFAMRAGHDIDWNDVFAHSMKLHRSIRLPSGRIIGFAHHRSGWTVEDSDDEATAATSLVPTSRAAAVAAAADRCAEAWAAERGRHHDA
jgi:hypothetical protein